MLPQCTQPQSCSCWHTTHLRISSAPRLLRALLGGQTACRCPTLNSKQSVQLPLQAQQRGASLMQPAAGRSAGQQPSAAAVGSSAFTALAEQDGLPDARFFHKYYRWGCRFGAPFGPLRSQGASQLPQTCPPLSAACCPLVLICHKHSCPVCLLGPQERGVLAALASGCVSRIHCCPTSPCCTLL